MEGFLQLIPRQPNLWKATATMETTVTQQKPKVKVLAIRINDLHTEAIVVLGLTEHNTNSSYAHHFLKSVEARQMAIAAAAKEGLRDPGLGTIGSVYPVDEKNEVVRDTRAGTVASWQIDMPVKAKLV